MLSNEDLEEAAARRLVWPSLAEVSEDELKALRFAWTVARDHHNQDGRGKVAEVYNDLAIAADDELVMREHTLSQLGADLGGETAIS